MKVYAEVPASKTSSHDLVASDRLKNQLEVLLATPVSKRKLLLAGPEGTGKTMTVSILAQTWKYPLYRFCIEEYLSMDWETSMKMASEVNNIINKVTGVWWFPLPNESELEGFTEQERNKYSQRCEFLLRKLHCMQNPGVVIISLTTSINVPLDLLRIVDDYLFFSLPDTQQIKVLLERKHFSASTFSDSSIQKLTSCSHAEICSICDKMQVHIAAGQSYSSAFTDAVSECQFSKDLKKISGDLRKLLTYWCG